MTAINKAEIVAANARGQNDTGSPEVQVALLTARIEQPFPGEYEKLRHDFNEAMGKLQEAMKSGLPKPLVTRDLLDAAAGVKPSTREWFASARNYALYANQGGAYDDVLKYLKM